MLCAQCVQLRCSYRPVNSCALSAMTSPTVSTSVLSPARVVRSVCLLLVMLNAAASMSCLGGTAAAAPLPFKPGDSVLCGSCPLVTPYYCRLGDLLCCIVVGLSFFVYYYAYVYFCCLRCLIFPLYLFLQYFDTVGWVFGPVKTVSYITYTVLAPTGT